MSKKQNYTDLGPIEFWYIDWANTLDSAGTIYGAKHVSNRVRDEHTVRMLHASMGLCTESAELLDAVKKQLFYGKDIDWANVLEEAGDVLWYVALIARELGHETFTEIMEANYRKLTARYGGIFTEDGALNRDIPSEMKALVNHADRPTVERCPVCGHRPHNGEICFNQESDNDCECRGQT